MLHCIAWLFAIIDRHNYKSLITSQKFLSLLGMTGNVIKHVQILCGLLAK